MRAWVSPVPYGVGVQAKVFRPGTDLRVVANGICDRAWVSNGTRVFRWPCGTVAAVKVGTVADEVLLRKSLPQLFATYARDASGAGPQLVEVLDALHWARFE